MKALKLLLVATLPAVALLGGCFGSSGTTATSAVSTRISYVGTTGPAAVSTSNATALLSGAYQGGQTGNAFGSAAALTGAATPQQSRTILLSQGLSRIIQLADLSQLTGSNGAAVNSVSHQVAGICGGQMSYTGTADDASNQFYATFTFSNYCQDATTFSGTANASGQVNTLLGFSTLSLSFDALTIASLGDSFTANGYEIITPASGSFTVKMNMLLRDNNSKRVYRFDQLIFTIEQGSGFVDLGISSGRYYDPRYGYVDLSTPTFLVINDGDYWPSSGILTGTGFNSSARFTAQSNTVYQLDVDSNGDGTPDSTTTGLWNAL